MKDEQRCEEKKLRNLISTIGLQLTYIEKVSLILLLKKANERAALEIVKRHEKKLYNLWRASRLRTPDNLINLSSRKLTLEEENILRFGLNHHILPKKISPDDIKVAVEKTVCSGYDDLLISSDTKDEIKVAVSGFIKNANVVCSTSPNQMYHETLSNLAKDESIKLCNFDKGNGLVILNSTDYYDKLNTIIHDDTKFCEVPVVEKKTHPIIQKHNSIRNEINQNLKVNYSAYVRSISLIIHCDQ